MLKEIGGYFGLDEFLDNEYYKNLISLNSGRNALIYLMKSKSIEKLYIPTYLCDSISHILLQHNYKFESYKIGEDLLPIIKRRFDKNEYIYIVNYFGQISNKKIISLKKEYGNIVIDNTHAFFQEPIKHIDTIYSCRKFFGVPDGSYLYTDARLGEELGYDFSKQRMKHILGRYEINANSFYEDFKDSDHSLKFEELKYMSRLTKNILKAIDYDKVKKTRDENFSFLKENLDKINNLVVYQSNGAFSYPLFISNGDRIRKLLAEKEIYIPTLWPNVLESMPPGSLEYQYALNILPIPCDQRYNVDDMRRIVNELESILK